ncbi:hypothetical protein PBCVNW6652_936R [Paramecium bursaria Chlorella virus NW665.2]|nr:hypothetical protein PBCVNW6652_936R [Paramecium bursaria Chlorella virus NW665.2]
MVMIWYNDEEMYDENSNAKAQNDIYLGDGGDSQTRGNGSSMYSQKVRHRRC